MHPITVSTPRSLKAFTSDLIDYAGLFPPAQCTLEVATTLYKQYRQGEYFDVLGHFVCPVRTLRELPSFLTSQENKEPLSLALIGSRPNEHQSFEDTFALDIEMMDAFQSEHGAYATFALYETQMPLDPGKIAPLLSQIRGKYGTVLDVFFEVPLDDRLTLVAPFWLEDVSSLARNLQPFGVKMRCGGVSAAHFPPSSYLAQVLWRCIQSNVRFKATAGLHHPLRHYNEALGTMMHGFVNVFGASILGAVHQLDVETIQDILDDEDPKSWRWDDEGVAWGSYFVPIDKIAMYRRTWARSYGSCSFDEPLEDLKSLGWVA